MSILMILIRRTAWRLPLLFVLFIVGVAFGLSFAPEREQIICVDGEYYLVKSSRENQSSSPTSTTDLIIIDTSRFRLTLFRNGNPVKSYPVAIGTPKTPTPIGEWKIIHKGGNWGGGFGARFMGINVPWGIYGIHGTNKPGSIGSRSSHGCIRMFNRDVLDLYEKVKVSTPVIITGKPPQVPLRRDFKRGNTGKDVLLLQYALRYNGFDPGYADARYGQGTEQAIKKLQSHYGLATTGSVTTNELYLLQLWPNPSR